MAHAGLWLLSLSSIAACLVDDHKCSQNQVVSPGTLLSCQCEPGHVLGPKGYDCVPCGENEVVSTAGKCECKTAYARSAASGQCEPVMGSYAGKPCGEADPCGAPTPYCATSESAPYCTTTGCTKNADCPMDWRCRSAGTERFCAKPPTGLGVACTAQSECQGNEANYCETFAAHVCIMKDCLQNPTDCPSGSVCCDLTRLLAQSICVIESALVNGNCPGGQPPVTQ